MTTILIVIKLHFFNTPSSSLDICAQLGKALVGYSTVVILAILGRKKIRLPFHFFFQSSTFYSQIPSSLPHSAVAESNCRFKRGQKKWKKIHSNPKTNSANSMNHSIKMKKKKTISDGREISSRICNARYPTLESEKAQCRSWAGWIDSQWESGAEWQEFRISHLSSILHIQATLRSLLNDSMGIFCVSFLNTMPHSTARFSTRNVISLYQFQFDNCNSIWLAAHCCGGTNSIK